MKPNWSDNILKCVETAAVIDDETKLILWSGDSAAHVGEFCWKALMGRSDRCPFCPDIVPGDYYSWDCYDAPRNRWLKIKYSVFSDEGRVLRAANFNAIDDMMELSRESVTEISSLQLLLRENQRIKKELEREAVSDYMTGLMNRNSYNTDIASGVYDKAGTGVIYFDINNLKAVNDKHRHEAGDMLICHVASAIRYAMEGFPGARGYRIGGDEFVIIAGACAEEDVRRIASAFTRFLSDNPTDPPCSAAVGIAYSALPCDAELLVSQADNAMYADKNRIKSQQ